MSGWTWWTRRTGAFLTVVVLTTAAAGAGCAVAPPAYTGAAGAPKVALLGDELLGSADGAVHQMLDVSYQSSVKGTAGATAEQLSSTANYYAGSNPDVVVIEAGTNDARQGVDAQTTKDAIRALVEAFPASTCVNVTTIDTRSLTGDAPDRATAVDAYIRYSLPTDHPNVAVLDWDQVVAIDGIEGSPNGPLIQNQLLTVAGTSYFATATTSMVDRCHAPATLSMSVFRDDNTNGVRDPGEPGVPGVVVHLLPDFTRPPAIEPLLDYQVTPPGGTVTHSGLPAGAYVVRAEGSDDASYTASTYSTPASVTGTLQAGQTTTIEIGLRPSGPLVVLLGDSILAGDDASLHETIGDSHRASVFARPVRRIAEIQPAADAYAPAEPDQVVIDLGTNDAQQNWPLADSIADLHKMLETFPGARCRQVVTITEQNPAYATAAAAINAEIRSLPTQYPNVHVLDWNQMLLDHAGDPGGIQALTPDLTHPSELGNQYLTQLVNDGVNACDAPTG